MIRDIFLSRNSTVQNLHNPSRRPRGKRQVRTTIAIGIATISCLFSANKIYKLSSEVSAVRRNQDHILSTIRRMEKEC